MNIMIYAEELLIPSEPDKIIEETKKNLIKESEIFDLGAVSILRESN